VDKWKEWKNKDRSFTTKTKISDLHEDFQTLFLSYDRYVREPLQQIRSQTRYSKLVQMLKNKTDLFSCTGSNAYKPYFDYTITNLLVDLEACLKCNSFCVSDSVPSNNKLTITRKNIGLACYRKTNFYNHSCVPNVAYCFESGDTVATYSLRNIQAGEQVEGIQMMRNINLIYSMYFRNDAVVYVRSYSYAIWIRITKLTSRSAIYSRVTRSNVDA